MADPLSIAAAVAGLISLGIQVTKGLVSYYAAYKGQASEVARSTDKLEQLLALLEFLQKQCGDRKFRADEQDLLDNIERSIQDCEELIQELQGELAKFEKTPTNGIRVAARTAGRRVTYPFRQSTLQKLDEDIDEICANLLLARQVLQQKVVSGVRDDIEDARAVLDMVRATQISSTIRDWLKAPDASINYNEACAKKHTGTGLWFVKGQAFNTWLTRHNSFLWLNGFAGCGKSVLASTAIQHAFRHRRSNPRIGIVFFFFTFNDESKQDTSAMLRALVLQLSSQLDENHSLLSRLHDSHRSAAPPVSALMDCLHQLIRVFEHVYIILDALDESPRRKHRKEMLQAVVHLRTWSEPGIHLLVTSRDEIDIRDDLDPSDDELISMKNDSVSRDIAAFVSGYLKSNRRLRKWEKYYGLIEKSLTERAKGVFRWVECQFIALESCPQSKLRLDRLLASLPESLDDTYERMLLNIDEASVQEAHRVLTLLCCAKRPLTIPELIDGIAVELGVDPIFNTDARYESEADIRQICPGFIEVDVHQGLGKETVTARIAHYSVQEYLESERICQQKAAKFSVKRTEAHTNIACICLTYLCNPALSMAGTSLDGYFLISYAAESWHEHYHDGDKSVHRLDSLALRLFRTRRIFETWIAIWDADYPWSRGNRTAIPSPVYYASLLGLESVLSSLLSHISLDPNATPSSLIVNAQGGRYGNALQAAAYEGHEKVVQQLLDRGADVNAQGGEYRTALQAASFGGHEKVVQPLLDRGADVNAQGEYYQNALQAAACKGHEKVVQLLLDRAADINAQGGYYGNALQAASFGGHEKVVQLLLDRGAEVNAEGGGFGHALQAASYKGHEKIVQLLLDRGADVNAQGGDFGNALRAASHIGDEKLVQLLLDQGANVNAQDGSYGNALQAASYKGHEKIVRLLLNRGADVNAQSGKYGTPLQAASLKGREKVVLLLLDKNADVNAQGGQFGNALQAAAYKGREKVVQLLLDRRADVNAQGGDFGNALRAASLRGHNKVVQLLLDRDADVKILRLPRKDLGEA